jgi:hypothetical protein
MNKVATMKIRRVKVAETTFKSKKAARQALKRCGLVGAGLLHSKHFRTGEPQKLQPRFWDSVRAPLRYGSRADLAELRDSRSTTEGADDLICRKGRVHPAILSALNLLGKRISHA